MSDLTISGSTAYPNSIDTATVLVDGAVNGSPEVAANINGPAAAILALENALGTLPQGSAATVAARFSQAHNNDGTLKSGLITGTGVTYAAGIYSFNAFPPAYSISASVGSNALTINLLNQAGNTPTTGAPALLNFRNTTLTTGVLSQLSVTGATSVTVPSTVTLGTTNSVAYRIYVGAINNAGTVELCVWNPTVSTVSLFGVSEASLVTTSAVATGNSAGVLYSTTARSSVPITIIGYIEISEVTAGTWNASPTVVQTMGPGVRRTGDVVQIVAVETGAMATGTGTFTESDTIPQNTGGTQYMSAAITPTSNVNLLHISARGFYSNSASAGLIQALFQDSTANALAANDSTVPSTQNTTLMTEHFMQAGTTSATTLKVRTGGQSGTLTFNGNAGGRYFGGVASSTLRIVEIFA